MGGIMKSGQFQSEAIPQQPKDGRIDEGHGEGELDLGTKADG